MRHDLVDQYAFNSSLYPIKYAIENEFIFHEMRERPVKGKILFSLTCYRRLFN